MSDPNERSPLYAIVFVLVVVAAVFGVAAYAVASGVQAHDIAIIGFIAFGTIIVLFAAAVLYQIGNGTIPLSGVISEPDGNASHTPDNKQPAKPKASLSRFQFLIFTFVVAGLFLMLSIEAGQMVDVPTNVLVLIGLSGTGFLAGKAVSQADPNANKGTPTPPQDQTDDTAK